MEGLPKNIPKTATEAKPVPQSFSEKLKEKSKSIISSVSKAGRRTFLAGALTATTLGVAAQERHAPSVRIAPKMDTTELMDLADLKQMAQTEPFTVLRSLEKLDSVKLKEVLPIMEEAMLAKDPASLLYMFSDHKNDPHIYDPAMVRRAFEAAAKQIEKEDNMGISSMILVNAGLLKDVPNGDAIVKLAFERTTPIVIVDEEYRTEYLKYPAAAEIAKPYVKKTVDDYIKKGHWGSIGPALNSFMDEPWAESVIRKYGESDPMITLVWGHELMSKPFGQEIMSEALKKVPSSVAHLQISKDTLSPELEHSILEAIKSTLEKKENLLDLFEKGPVFQTIPGGDALYRKLALLLTVDHPSVVLDEAYTSKLDWLGDETKKELIQVSAESANPRHIFMYAELFSAEPYGKKIIEQAARLAPFEVIGRATKLIPREDYVDIIRDAVNVMLINDPHSVLYNTVVLDLITTDPQERDQLLEKVVRATADEENGEFTLVAQYNEYSGKPYAGEVLQNALLGSPPAITRATPETKRILESNQNPYIQTLLSMSNNTDIAEMSEFRTKSAIYSAVQYITEKNITVDSSLTDPANLFAAYMYARKSAHPVGLKGIETNMRSISNSLIQKINRMHDDPDSIRFAAVSEFEPEILYNLATYGEQEAFTSTFNGLFNRILGGLQEEQKSGYAFLEGMSFLEGRTFIRECASYNRLDEFLNTMPKEDQRKLLEWFISGITNEKEVLTEGVVIADVISSIEDKSILDVFGASIKKKYTEGVESKNRSVEVAYGLLAELYARQTGNADMLPTQEGDKYHIEQLTELSKDSLFGPEKTSIHRYYFYNDSDGQGSFASFMDQYKRDPSWSINDKEEYVIISSTAGEKIKIFANKPFAVHGNEIDSILDSKHTPVNVVVHRGHSFHAEKTVDEIPSTAALVSLGSCGGYRLLDGVLDHSPNAHVISTKGTGTMKVNDPILKAINEEIRAGHSIKWTELWTKFEDKLGGNPNFKNYVPPNKNLGLMFMSAYRKLMENKEK